MQLTHALSGKSVAFSPNSLLMTDYRLYDKKVNKERNDKYTNDIEHEARTDHFSLPN